MFEMKIVKAANKLYKCALTFADKRNNATRIKLGKAEAIREARLAKQLELITALAVAAVKRDKELRDKHLENVKANNAAYNSIQNQIDDLNKIEV